MGNNQPESAHRFPHPMRYESPTRRQAALVTGSTGGIGLAIAAALAAEGARVI